jgi:hypothetical protein
MAEYKEARDGGATESIAKPDPSDKPPEVDGTEDIEDYKAKRNEQEGKGKGGGAQKKIDRLTRERAALRERLARYEAPDGSSLTERNQEHVTENESDQAARNGSSPQEDSKTAELRKRYPDWDAVMSRAKSEGMRISDAAAKELHASDNAGHLAYLLANDDALRREFNKLSPERQVQEIRKIDREIRGIEGGQRPFADKMKAAFSEDEISEIVKAAKSNELGDRLGGELAKELHELPNGPEVFRHLIEDPELCKRIAGMSRSAASLELGRISGRLERNVRQTSNAPPPIRPVHGGSSRSSVPLDEMPMEDYKKARAAGRVR